MHSHKWKDKENCSQSKFFETESIKGRGGLRARKRVCEDEVWGITSYIAISYSGEVDLLV